MRKTAVALMIAGLLFTTLTLPMAGIDLLLDPVGFLLVFNGANMLRKYGDRFGPCVPLCLALVAASAVELFLSGAAGAAVGAARALAEAALYLLLLRGFWPLRQSGAMAAVVAAGLGLAALATLAGGALSLLGWAAAPALGWASLACRLAAPAALLWPALALDDIRPSPPGAPQTTS